MRERIGGKRQSFLQGAFVLTVAMAVVKLIGMLYKIPLGNILGAGGMSYFMSAYSIFNPVYALSVTGLPVAVSKLVSENLARGRYGDVKRIRRVSIGLFLATGLAGMLVMLLGGRFFADLIGNPGAALSIAAIAPAIFFCCIISSFRGYRQGLHNMTPTALSQVVESIAKLVCGIAFAQWFLNRGLAEYAASGTVWGRAAADLEQARMLALPYAAAGAVLGVTASTLAGALFLFGDYALCGDGFVREQRRQSPAPARRREIAGQLLQIALPVCLTAAVAHVGTLIDVVTIMNRIEDAIRLDAGTVLASHARALPAGLPPADTPSYLYGALSYTTSLFNLVPAFTTALGVSALPAIASDWATGSRTAAEERVRSVIKLSALIAIPAGLGLTALAEPILTLLYPALASEIAIAAPLLRKMGVAAVFVGITTPMMSVFQAIGKAMVPVKMMLAGAALKIAVNYALIGIPGVNINGAPYGTAACYLLILLLGLFALSMRAGIELRFGQTLLKPLLCGIICAVAAHTSCGLLARLSDSRLVTLVSIAIGAGFYVVFALFLRIIAKNEILMLPNGKNFAKILEKLRVLG